MSRLRFRHRNQLPSMKEEDKLFGPKRIHSKQVTMHAKHKKNYVSCLSHSVINISVRTVPTIIPKTRSITTLTTLYETG